VLTSVTTTPSIPLLANKSEVANPIPYAPPVTTATFPFSLSGFGGGVFNFSPPKGSICLAVAKYLRDVYENRKYL